MRRKIIVFSNYYLPGVLAGGPIRSIEGLIKKLAEYYDFDLVTSSHDAFSNEDYINIELNKWNDLGYANCLYLSDKKRSLRNIYNILKEKKYDIIYLNSFFNFWYSIIPVFIYKFFYTQDTKLILAPRGEFNINALSNNSLKKRFFLIISKIIGLHNNLVWHASTKYEAIDIKVFFPNASIKVVENVSLESHQKEIKKKIKLKNQLDILFFSRITKMKNLTGALRIISNLKEKINFNIYGPKEDINYYKSVLSAINEIPENIKININGPLKHEKIKQVFDLHHLFFLPTLGENYGHVIRESIANNCPAIISNKTPWNNLESDGIGFVCNIDNDHEFIEKINFFLGMNQEEYDMYIKKMYSNVERLFDYSDVVSDNLNLFE